MWNCDGIRQWTSSDRHLAVCWSLFYLQLLSILFVLGRLKARIHWKKTWKWKNLILSLLVLDFQCLSRIWTSVQRLVATSARLNSTSGYWHEVPTTRASVKEFESVKRTQRSVRVAFLRFSMSKKAETRLIDCLKRQRLHEFASWNNRWTRLREADALISSNACIDSRVDILERQALFRLVSHRSLISG